MNNDLSEKFFANVKWFNNFFHDLKLLLDKITSQIEGYDIKKYYYFKASDLPAIPKLYYILLQSDYKLSLNLSVILDKNIVTNPFIIVDEPLIHIALHNNKEHDPTWVTLNILENNNLMENTEKDGLITGVIDWGENYNKIQYFSFVVPLDVFNDYNDQAAKEMIVDKVNKIQAEYDENADEE